MTKTNPIKLEIAEVVEPIELWFTDVNDIPITEIDPDTPYYIKGKLNQEPKSDVPVYLFFCEAANPDILDYVGLMDRTSPDGSFSFFMSSGGHDWRQCFRVMACRL